MSTLPPRRALDTPTPLERLARDDAPALEAQQLAEGRARLLRALARGAVSARHAQRTRERRRARAGAMALAAVVAAAAAWVLMVRPRAGRPSSTAGVATVEGAMRFTDGSSVLVGSAVLSVESHDGHATELQLVRGHIRAQVVHYDDTRWLVRAGPFRVRVVGTRFDLDWDPEARAFALTLHEGAVVVDGPGLEARSVRAGEHLRAALEHERYVWWLSGPTAARSTTRDHDAAAATAPDATAPEPQRDERTRASELVEPSAHRAPSDDAQTGAPARSTAAIDRPSRVAGLPRGGDDTQVLRVAQSLGYASFFEAASPTDLARLCLALRRAHDDARALACYETARRRFAGADVGVDASFFAARIAHDRGDLGRAASLFAAYLAARPAGPYAETAAGRRLECLAQLGSHAALAREAQQYLRQFPQGAHAAFARTHASP